MITQLYDLLGQKYPFGRGTDGNVNLTSDPHTRRRCSGSSGSTTLTLTSGGAFTNDDVVLIHQSRGLTSSAQQNWEVNKIVSGAGSTSLTLLNALGRTYTNSTYEFTQVVDVKEYLNLTMNSFTASGWNYTTGVGGFLALAVAGVCTWNGTPSLAGASGGSSISDQGGAPTTGVGGFRGGANSTDGSHAWTGEGYLARNWPPYEQSSSGDNGGGGGNPGGDTGGAGGGGISSGGSNAQQGSAVGGAIVGNSALTSAVFGGGGGGGRNDGDQNAGGGGNGGGGIFAWIKVLNLSSGGFNARGGNGGPSSSNATSGGGGGGGGFGLFNINQATFSTNFNASAGSGQNKGGNGGSGGFRINYFTAPTGTTSPAASTAFDAKLKVPAGMMQVIA